MKHVRLPIYDENGLETGEKLEIDLNFFLPSNPALKSNMARVISREVFRADPIQEPLAEWEKELLNSGAFPEEPKVDEVGLIDVSSKYPEDPETDGCLEWRVLEDIPTNRFEICKHGYIRIRGNEKIMDPVWDPDAMKFTVRLRINGQNWFIDGPLQARRMWNKK